MQTAIFTPKDTSEPQSKKTAVIKLVIAFIFIGAIGGVGWWWFIGSKPRVVLTVPFVASEQSAGVDCWPTSRGEIAVLGAGKMTLVDLKSRKELWSVPMPLAVQVDRVWQESVAMRFLKLQKRAEELAVQRGKLKGDAATKAFNVEAAKYASELAIARADAARPTAPPPSPVAKAAAGKKARDIPGGEQGSVEQLKPIELEDDSIRRARMTKRAEQIEKLKGVLSNERTAADTRLKLQKLRDDEARLHTLEQEQMADEVTLSPAANAPAVDAAVKPTENEPSEDYAYASGGRPKFVELGDNLWLAEGSRLIGFEQTGGGVKTNMLLPGPVTRMVKVADAAFFIAYAGKTVRYVVKVGANGSTQTSYIPTAEEKAPSESSAEIRNEFFGGGGSLSLAEIRLIAKPAADAPNERTYAVSVKRPFASATPTWTGEFSGRVQCFSTPSLSIVTGGTKLVALDANNAKLWESTLAEPAIFGDSFQWETAHGSPCREHDDRLYFFDRAVLTSFNSSTGEVIWRLPGAGIRKVEFGGDGSLYVHSMNHTAETPVHLSEVKSGSAPVLMKINPADGTILWSEPKLEDVWASGKDVYSMRVARQSQDGESETFQPGAQSTRMKIYKLNTNTGKQRWDWFQTQMPQRIIVQGKTVAVLFESGLQVIHSTAL